MFMKRLLPVLLAIGVSSACMAQFPSMPNMPSRIPSTRKATPRYRTIITYNGGVCIAAPNYDVMPSGQVIYKHQGMRFDGAGYFWSPSVRDNIVRRNRYATRIVGTANQYWPPLAPTPSSSNGVVLNSAVNTPPAGATASVRKPGDYRANRRTVAPSATAATVVPQTGSNRTANTTPRLVRCPNGSYAIICR